MKEKTISYSRVLEILSDAQLKNVLGGSGSGGSGSGGNGSGGWPFDGYTWQCWCEGGQVGDWNCWDDDPFDCGGDTYCRLGWTCSRPEL